MRVGFYNPYLDGFGGGERYTLTLAAHWSKKHRVELFWDDPVIISASQTRFGLDLSRLSTVPNVFGTNRLFSKMAVSHQYDCIFFLTDGSIPTTLARHNILHFQVPFSHIDAHPFKLRRFDTIVCNSHFTQSHIDPKVGKDSCVIYPPVIPVKDNVKVRKEKVILSVGRFTGVHTMKKQLILMDAFIGLESQLPEWKLVLAGGLLSTDVDYMSTLQKKARGHRIELAPNISRDALDELYQKASLYWHAAGFGETNPEYMEHFGITTIEAMSAGAVPIVFDGGGQTEIVLQGENGYVWKKLSQLIDATQQLVADKKLYSSLQQSAKMTWSQFSEQKFTDAFDSLISGYSDTNI